ncbi:MAG: phosphotransferase [Acidobacteria bacterium]|nr:phosphotransferase [Acidobacteriota bacterium]
MSASVLVGVDFDNTIVRCDHLFHGAAIARGLIPATVGPGKGEVREYLRGCGREDAWTELQGYVYGVLIQDAPVFPGVRDFFERCRERGVGVCIISHKTRYPFLGPAYDLHRAAHEWLERQGFYDPQGMGLARAQVFFELTKRDKLQRIARMGCSHFVDDLPEVLTEPEFPMGVRRILFDPNGRYPNDGQLDRATSWAEVEQRLTGEPARVAVLALAAEAGLGGEIRLRPLEGNTNNRVFHVEAGGRAALLKVYFEHPGDPRDRLGAEFSFSRFAWRSGVRCLPQPLACDRLNRLGLYEFVEGRSLRPADVTAATVHASLDFYHAVNGHRERREARAIPDASEACFSIAEHLTCVERRIGRLQEIDRSSPADREAAALVEGELGAAWREVAAAVRRDTAELGVKIGAPLPMAERRLSPSDFGFHNAILATDGRLRFIDFEYAGWDDPAKMVCDFFCQPAIPVPLEHFAGFVESVARDLPEPERHRSRCALLLPVYQIKWCCILLNDFLPVSRERRRFADGVRDPEERKVEQLHKARRALARVGAMRGAAGAL